MVTATWIATAIAALGPVQTRAAEPSSPARLVFHEDCQVLVEAPTENTEQFIRDWIDREVALGPITTFVVLAAMPDLCTFRTRTGELFGQRFDFKRDGWSRTIKSLRDRDTDIVEVCAQHLRPQGIEVLAAIRMNDTHHTSVSADDELCPMFTVEHPEYVIRQPDGRTNETALDYSHPEVRAHRLAILEDLVERYEIDGLELNFCRWAKHFPRDMGPEKASIMTDFVGRIRRLLDEKATRTGRSRMTLAVQVPEGVHECLLAGLDVPTWVESGWIDYVTVCTWNEVDPQLPLGEFAPFIEGTDCQLLAAMGNMMGGTWIGLPKITRGGIGQFRDGYAGMLLMPPEARACAANYYAWGAQGISLWNIGVNMGSEGKFATEEHVQNFREWIAAVATVENVYKEPRRYLYLPIYKGISRRKPPARNYPWYDEGQSPLGRPKTQILHFDAGAPDKRQIYRFRMADGRRGEALDGELRFRIYYARPNDDCRIEVNGIEVDPARVGRMELDADEVGLPGVEYRIALVDCPPLRGDNELGLALAAVKPAAEVPYMEVLDILVRGPIGK